MTLWAGRVQGELDPAVWELVKAQSQLSHVCPFCDLMAAGNPVLLPPKDGAVHVVRTCNTCGRTWAVVYLMLMTVDAQTCPQCRFPIVAGDEVRRSRYLFSNSVTIIHAACADSWAEQNGGIILQRG